MDIQLIRATIEDAEIILTMQKKAFAELLDKYRDYDTNPGNESIDKVRLRLEQEFTFFYFIVSNGDRIGAIRIVDKQNDERKRISPLFILPEFQGRGFAQRAIQLAEEKHGSDNWQLGTILQEEKNCHLYEKMGYNKTGTTKQINDKLTLVIYEK